MCFPPPQATHGELMQGNNYAMISFILFLKGQILLDIQSLFLIILGETPGWHSITGRFISVMGATNCCANKKAPEGISPSAHLADGCIDLVVVRHTSRSRYLHHMIRLAGRADHVSD